jgi:hypothetical protein
MVKWIEFQGQDPTIDKVADDLTNFVLHNAIPIQVAIQQADANTWKLTSGAESRSLTNDQMKQVVESSSKLDIKFSETATIGCSEKSQGANSYCGSVDKKFNGVDDNGIKWQQDGTQWIPTSMTLYSVSQDKISDTSTQSVVNVLAKDGGMLVASVQPVAVDVIPGSDVDLIIQKAVSELKSHINTTLPMLDAFTPGKPIGMDTAAVKGGTGTQNWKDCLPGQFVAGVNPYMEDGSLKLVLNCKALPKLQVP